MLTETEIHYVVGFLFAATGTEDISVVLGEKVYDSASDSKRDVDVVIATAESTGIAAAEVKDERRPLDVIAVEGLCSKLNDMPSITRRMIASASGYTAPAMKKAKAHGVECLKIVRGPVPHFPTVDITQLKALRWLDQHWLRFDVTVKVEGTVRPEVGALLNDSTPVEVSGEPNRITYRALTDQIAHGLLQRERVPVGESPWEMKFTPQNGLQLILGNDHFEISSAVVRGVARCTETHFPFDDGVHLQDETGAPFAATVLADVSGLMIGFAVAAESNSIRTFSVPKSVREKRPIRHKIV